MPIYKFRCVKCSNIEELFCSFSQKDNKLKNLVCSKCKNKKFTEVFKLNIAGSSDDISSSGSGCSSCKGGSCNTCSPDCI
ncbi:zinc ribbon domain-containing protein [Candidatus Woesearchaeota archaeon]|nr:zinc ribbon domain-containing protein [Candidatus Woesearchaeota archaeon]